MAQTLGMAEFFKRMVGYLEADYLRWNEVRQMRPRGQPFRGPA